MKMIYRLVNTTFFIVTALLIKTAALQAQNPAGTNPTHKKTTNTSDNYKAGKTTTPKSTSAASTPAATGSGPSSSDIHARVAVPSPKQPLATTMAAARATNKSASQANTPKKAGIAGGKRPQAIKTIPPPAATGSGPSSSDIHPTSKPATAPAVKSKPVKRKSEPAKS